MNHFQQLAFISAYKDNLTLKENQQRHKYMSAILTRLKVFHRDTQGMFKGRAEKSFLVHITRETTLELVQSIALEFDQEEILYRDSNNQVWGVNARGDQESLGTFRKITKEQAAQVTAWTRFNNEFFTTTKKSK